MLPTFPYYLEILHKICIIWISRTWVKIFEGYKDLTHLFGWNVSSCVEKSRMSKWRIAWTPIVSISKQIMYLATFSVKKYIGTYSWKFDEFIICTEKIKPNTLLYTVSSFLIYEQKDSILEMHLCKFHSDTTYINHRW